VTERLISADSHVSISHDQVKAHLAAKHHAAYDDAQGAFAERMRKAMGAGSANVSAMKQNPHAAFTRAGYTDGAERLKDMDTDGVNAEVIYSEVSAFRYIGDMRDGASEATRAFNDVMSDFASADPKRLLVSYQIPIHDIDDAVLEVRRVADAGAKSLQLPVFPTEIGLPDYYDSRYHPLWATIQDVDLPICCHIGLNTNLDDLTRRDPTPQKGVMVPMTALSTAEAFGMWILTGVLDQFPNLKLVFVEPGLGWVAWYLYIIDDMVTRQGYAFPAIKEPLPSTYFHRNMSLTFIDEPDALQRLRDRIGVENILWSTDYPHPVTSWPDSRALIDRAFVDIPADERELILAGNATRVWNL
jgi:predicted TIM-barrel fold metal-dependent hydrolase